MKKLVFIVAALFSSAAILASPSDNIPADNPNIEYAGRIDFSNPKAPRYAYSGVSIRASFQGTSISAILEDEKSENQYLVIIDKVVTKRFVVSKGNQTYPLATNLANNIHEIELYKLTEELCGKTTFLGFLLDRGKKLLPLKDPRTRLMEFVGNSITCGASMEIPNGEKGNSTNENHYLSYGAITSRNFNARNLTVSKSGVGLFVNSWGFVNATSESPGSMRNYYSRTFYTNATPIYTFTQKPDLICVDLGTNDFGKKVDSASFVNCYIDFIDTLQTRNKQADIICLIGPMTSGKSLVTLRNCVQTVVKIAYEKNNGKVYFFELSTQGALGFGGGYHPTIGQHAKNANELTEFISKLKSWEITPSKTAYLNIRQAYKTLHSEIDTCKFGEVKLDSPKTVTLTIENVGGSEVELKGNPHIAISGSGYTLEADAPATISAGKTYTFQIKLTPSTTGIHEGRLSINFNGSNENPYQFMLSGKGIVTTKKE